MTWIWIIGAGILCYGGLVLWLYLNQYRLLYVPQTYTLAEAQQSARQRHLALWPTAGSHYLGLVSTTAPQSIRGTVLVFHGNAGSALTRDFFVHALSPLGLRVVLVEYPGYGAKDGRLGQASLVAAGIEAVQQAILEFGDPIILVGESMGCGVACAVAAEPSVNVRGLLLITPWDTLPNLAQQIYWGFPTRWFTRDTYDNITHCQTLHLPIGILLARQDQVIPNNRTMNLVRALGDCQKLWSVDAGHNDWMEQTSASWWRDVMEFVSPS